MGQTIISNKTQVYEWGEGSFKLNITSDIALKQFKSAEEALDEGYLPIGSPRSWELGSHNFNYEEMNDYHRNKKSIANLTIGELDLQHNNTREVPAAYVISAVSVRELRPRVGGGPIGDYFRISAQFYRKN